MKAHINGITVEGTPQEIMEYQRLRAIQAKEKPFSEVCRDLGRSIGTLMAVSHGVERMNQQIKQEIRKQNVSRNLYGVKIYGVSKTPNSEMTN